MRLNADRPLSPQTVEMLEALLDHPSSDSVSEEELTRLVLRDCSLSEREALARRVSLAPESQARLVELWREYRSLTQQPLSMWPRESLFFERVRSALLEAEAAWGTLGRNLRTALSVPKFTTARGEGNAALRLFAEVSEEGTLHVTAPSVQRQEGWSATLKLVDPLGGLLFLATARVEEGSLRFSKPAFGPLLELQSGPLPSELFIIEWEGEETTEPKSRRLWADGSNGEIISIDLISPPGIENGLLTLRLRISEEVAREYTDKKLVLFVPVGEQEIELASEPMIRLIETGVFSAPVEGIPSATVPLGSMIRARLADIEVV